MDMEDAHTTMTVINSEVKHDGVTATFNLDDGLMVDVSTDTRVKLKPNLVAKMTLNSKRYMLRPTRVKMQTDSCFTGMPEKRDERKKGKGRRREEG